MSTPSNLERFNVSKVELAKLGSEFKSEALPMIDKLYQASFWILLNKKFANKIIKQTFIEAIEDCNVTKNEADWQSWILRIWMREILDFYSIRENDIQTIFDFIDNCEIGSEEVAYFSQSNNLKSTINERELIKTLEKLPAVLRIPTIMKEMLSFNYEKIAELIDVPTGVIATRIYRARKLLFLLNRNNFPYEEEKRKWGKRESTKKIFDLRRCALFADEELVSDQKSEFLESTRTEAEYKIEIQVQQEIKNQINIHSSQAPSIKSLLSKIKRKAEKKFCHDLFS